jgi:hypothetical protein
MNIDINIFMYCTLQCIDDSIIYFTVEHNYVALTLIYLP